MRTTMRYWLPLAAAVLCLYVASMSVPPLVIYGLIIASFALCFDAATAWFAKAGGTGGVREYKQ